jgi:hypothetical protein
MGVVVEVVAFGVRAVQVVGEDIVSVFETEWDGVVAVSVAVIFSRAPFKDRSSFAVAETSL